MTWTTRPRSEVGGRAAIQTGAGPDVLLLHGVGLRAEAWGAQLSGLAAQARMTAPDMPGHGESPMPDATATLQTYTDAAFAVLNCLKRPVLVAGHSMGAMIALSLAAEASEHVCGVVALNAVFERSAEAAKAVVARARRLDGTSTADPTETLERWFGDTPSPERTACREWLTAINPLAYKYAYTVFAEGQQPQRDTLGKLDCPALFLTGSCEPNATPDMSRSMAKIAPMGRAFIVEGAAHMMPMTHASKVNAALLRFLREVRS